MRRMRLIHHQLQGMEDENAPEQKRRFCISPINRSPKSVRTNISTE
jgi:hypothetical protein